MNADQLADEINALHAHCAAFYTAPLHEAEDDDGLQSFPQEAHYIYRIAAKLRQVKALVRANWDEWAADRLTFDSTMVAAYLRLAEAAERQSKLWIEMSAASDRESEAREELIALYAR